jgi:hypothetical protein
MVVIRLRDLNSKRPVAPPGHTVLETALTSDERQPDVVVRLVGLDAQVQARQGQVRETDAPVVVVRVVVVVVVSFLLHEKAHHRVGEDVVDTDGERLVPGGIATRSECRRVRGVAAAHDRVITGTATTASSPPPLIRVVVVVVVVVAAAAAAGTGKKERKKEQIYTGKKERKKERTKERKKYTGKKESKKEIYR